MPGRLLSKAKWTREPGSVRLSFIGVLSVWRTFVLRLKHHLRLLRLRPGSVDRPKYWRGRPGLTVTAWVSGILAALLLAWMARAVYVAFILRKPWSVPPNADRMCSGVAVSCGALTGWATSLLSIALASVVFLLWRFWRVERRYLARARAQARALVPTAGPMFGTIVGRDTLCHVIMEDLRDRRSRRPYVLVGGVGTGKTAVLVLLTEMLASHKAIPVPIRLRDADPLDFAELARNRFMEIINKDLASAAEGEKIWRRLLSDGRVVVLADGLEEALSGTKDEEERDSKIRFAIRKAYDERLPLLIASRPHTPLRDMDAAVHELEPLSEDAALSYVEEDGPTEDERRLNWIMKTADASDAPLYLQVTKQIYGLDMLDHIASRQADLLGTPGHDPSSLRVRLLKTWEEALLRGDLRPDVPLRPDEREVALDWLSALACAGLRDDSLEVRLDSLLGEEISNAVHKRLGDIDDRTGGKFRLRSVDVRLAAAWAARLGLVEPLPGRVRFQHSLIQAYLGSRLMHAALRDTGYVGDALKYVDDKRNGAPVRRPDGRGAQVPAPHDASAHTAPGERPGPGREFLIALVLHSRHKLLDEEKKTPASRPRPRTPRRIAREPSAMRWPGPPLADATTRPSISMPRRWKSAASHATTMPAPSPMRYPPCPTSTLAKQISEEWGGMHSGDPQTLEEAKLGLVGRFGEALRTLAARLHPCPRDLGYAELYRICRDESSYRIRLAAAQEIGRGGTVAYRELARKLSVPAEGEDADDETQRAQQVSAWLAPLLIASIDAEGAEHGLEPQHLHAREFLRQWLRLLEPGEPHRSGLTFSQEIALAQGFKYAANHRYGHVHHRPAALGYLQEEALEMLKRSRYWFSQLTLIQALCLYQIQASQSATSGQHANPDAIVNHWLQEISDGSARDARRGRGIHPFVKAAAVLASRALETGQPERFLWMDESDVVTRIGSGEEAVAARGRRHDQWILPSMGWSGLDWRAQQLVADVLLLLNLAERGEQPDKMEQWLERANKDILPPCIRRNRLALKPDCTVGTAESNPPGSNCLDGCPFDLCPYPPKGQQPHRAELSEAFCRHQHMLVRRGGLGRRTAPWQGLRPMQMREFWTEMSNRTRIGPGGR